MDIEGWGGGKPTKTLDIIKNIPRPTDIVGTGTGTAGDGWLYNLGQGAKDIAEGVGGAIGSGIGALGSGAANVLGGVGNVAKKIGQTIIPGGETGYADLYGGLGQGAGNILGGAGNIAQKIGQTIIPGGETGYGDIYGALGNIFGSPVRADEPIDIEDLR